MIKISRELQKEEAEAINQFRDLEVKGIIIFPAEREKYNVAILRLTLDRFPLMLIDRYFIRAARYQTM